MHRILIVEDNPGVGQLLKVVLEREGAHVLWLTTGTDALAQIESYHPSMILIDLGLPDMDGMQLSHSIQQISLNPAPFCVGMSGGFIDPDESRSFNGFDICLSKPIPLKRLKTLLDEVPGDRLLLPAS